MQWNDSTKFRGVVLKGTPEFRSIELLEWRTTVEEVKADLKKIKAGYLTFIRNEHGFSCLPHNAQDKYVGLAGNIILNWDYVNNCPKS